MNFKTGIFYISGPMAGIKDFNYPAFHAAEKRLRELTGCKVLNPAAHAELELGLEYEDFIKMSLTMIEICTHVILLDGWHNSPGAQRERAHAVNLGKNIIRQNNLGQNNFFNLNP